ncbi:MAG: hypothetical protein JXR73_11560 [Candidatus Omnitrophica bacterium]|nr:hypothetical protein [Candidatus Omnitrophota bacterium]
MLESDEYARQTDPQEMNREDITEEWPPIADDLVCADPPVWRLYPQQRITYKTVAGALSFLILFMAILFWVNGPKAYNRIEGSDLQRDGLAGPVKRIVYSRSHNDLQFAQISGKPMQWAFYYDRNGRRIQEEYFARDGSTSSRVIFTHDSLGSQIDAKTYNADGWIISEVADKQFGLFDPIPISVLQNDPQISSCYYEEEYDSQGNWTRRNYRVRRHSLLYERNDIGYEAREIEYYDAVPEPAQTPNSSRLIEGRLPNEDCQRS